jgi:serine/threonine protein phosphatase PrpC
MTLNIDAFRQFGISIKGPQHIKNKLPNQDAWMGAVNHRVAFIVVCDGLGSREHSHEGARAACLAVRDAVMIWAKSCDSRVDNLLRLIKQLWEIRIAPHNINEFATTCLFAAALPNQGLLVSGLGDGIAIVSRPHRDLDIIVERNSDFTNQTVALGTPHKLADWHYKLYAQPPEGTIVLLASDGVADDLRRDRLAELPAWISNTYGSMPGFQRYFALQHELKQWSTPGHQDDKTIALLFSTLL